MKRLWMAVALAGVIASALAVAQPGKARGAPAAAVEPVKKGRLVFTVTTGLEDVQTLNSSFRHAQAALASGHLEKVIWLGYGRSAVVFDPTVKAVPDEVRKAAAAAKAAGVELVVCNNSLEKYGIDPGTLQPQARVVPNAMTELALLVSQGFEVISY
ncbi:MAG: DsrE family protein [Myxococcota bacterium]|nr:DsrE family protein [Myxococcota bacterium]